MGNLCEVAAMKSVYVRYFCRNIKSIFSVKIQSECKKKQKLHSLLSKEHAESIRKQMLFLFSFSKFCELFHFIYTTYTKRNTQCYYCPTVLQGNYFANLVNK